MASASQHAPGPADVAVEPPGLERLDPVPEPVPVPEPAPVPTRRSADVSVPIPRAVEPALPADARPAVTERRTKRVGLGAVLLGVAAVAGAWVAQSARALRAARARTAGARSGSAGATPQRLTELQAGEAVYARVVASIERHATALAGQRRRGIARDAFGKVVDTRGWLESRAAYVDKQLALTDAEYRALGAYFRAVERAAVPERSHVRARLEGLVLERELERCLADRVTAANTPAQGQDAVADPGSGGAPS